MQVASSVTDTIEVQENQHSQNPPGVIAWLWANPSIERTVSSGLRPLPTAAHVKR